MLLKSIGLLYSIIVTVVGAYIYGFKLFIYLTSWCSFIHMITFLCLLFEKTPSNFTKNLLITAWTIGWLVCILFWVFIFPLVDSSKLPPIPQYLSTHGGVHILISVLFVQSKIKIEKKDIFWPALVCFFYFFGMIVPLKFYGIVVYPYFLEKIIPTVIVLLGNFGILYGAFTMGYQLKQPMGLKIN